MLSATSIADSARCEHKIFLDAFGDPQERLPGSEFLELLWESGRVHEEEVLARLAPSFISTSASLTERAAATRARMASGDKLICHGVLISGDLVGEPDLLERAPSRASVPTYLPVDVKAASAFDDSAKKKPKESYQLQLSAYAELLEACQGVRPEVGKIIDRQGETQILPLRSFQPEYEAARDRVRGILDRTVPTRPGRSDCKFCVWTDSCTKALEEADDLTLVAGLGVSYREKLQEAGIATVTQLSAASPSSLTSIKGIKDARAAKWIRQARVQKSGNPELLERWTPPVAEYEVSYDIEDFLPEDFVYLHGFLVRPAGAPPWTGADHPDFAWGSYNAVCASMPGDTEKAVWQRLLENVAQVDALGNYVVYVYSHHERTTINRLTERYGGSHELTHFTDRFIDLQTVAQRTVVFPTQSMSLKSLASWIGFRWRDEDPGGAQSMVWWNEYASNPNAHASARDRLIAYNEDDVRASLVLRDWLESRSRTN